MTGFHTQRLLVYRMKIYSNMRTLFVFPDPPLQECIYCNEIKSYWEFIAIHGASGFEVSTCDACRKILGRK
jgi:hypothetical protein